MKMYYTSEEHPLMWWDKVERELKGANVTLHMSEGRKVYDDQTGLAAGDTPHHGQFPERSD
eukprot:scaffold12890_cov85-Cylindrotheca_fusiformis.AAC.1